MSQKITGTAAIVAPPTGARSELRASFERLLTTPAPQPIGPMLELTAAQIEEKIEESRQWAAIDALRLADAYGLDDTAAVGVAIEFMRLFNQRIAAYTAEVTAR